MISLEKREYVEKLRSAREAAQINSHLLVREETIARYRAPSETTVFPLEYAFHLLGDVTGKTIFEFGSGDGLNTVVLANRRARIIAFDISPELLKVARKRLEVNGCDDVDLLIGSAHRLPIPDESVDIIFGIAILHHLDLKLASEEVSRVLKKGGRAIFLEPMRNSKFVARVRRLLPKRAEVSPFERPLTDQDVREFAAPYKYRARTFQLLLSSLAPSSPFKTRKAIKLSARVDDRLLRLFPSLEYYGTIKVFEMIKE
jgi:SAM-dependent methyltransferase